MKIKNILLVSLLSFASVALAQEPLPVAPAQPPAVEPFAQNVIANPQAFQSTALAWIGVLTTVVTALSALALSVQGQIKKIKAQNSAQENRLDTHDEKLSVDTKTVASCGAASGLAVADFIKPTA